MEPSTSDRTRCIADDELFALALGQLDAHTRARAESHLSRCSDCRTVLAEVAQSLEARMSTSAHASEVRIARYQLLEVIGTGASGIVYRAYDPNLRRVVALKLLRADTHAPSTLGPERMLREAQAMAQLSHPNVVAVFDIGVHDGSVYIVMEYVDGHTLSEWLTLEPRSRQEILRVFREAAQGLNAAHEKGLVHRDFKPANVLVHREGKTKVTDFGLSRMHGAGVLEGMHVHDSVSDAMTLTRGLIGTPAYMAPELFDGKAANFASDQYAFCVALYSALAERHPFHGDNGVSLSEFITRAKSGVIEPPAGKRLPAHLDNALRRGLSAAPEARFPDMRALLSACEPSRSSRSWVTMFAVLAALLTLALIVARTTRIERNQARSAGTVSTAEAASSKPPPNTNRVEVVPPATVPAVEPPLESAPAAATSGQSRVRKAANKQAEQAREVRYRDWLKEPF